MMKVEQIKTPDDIERYIEGCLNDFEAAISTKDETIVLLAKLVVYIYKAAKKDQLTTPAMLAAGKLALAARSVTTANAKNLSQRIEKMEAALDAYDNEIFSLGKGV